MAETEKKVAVEATAEAAEKKPAAKKAPAKKPAAKKAPAKKAAAKKVQKLQVTLKKSLIGRSKKQIATANSLGLKKPGDTTVQPDNVATQGKIAVISFLVEVAKV